MSPSKFTKGEYIKHIRLSDGEYRIFKVIENDPDIVLILCDTLYNKGYNTKPLEANLDIFSNDNKKWYMKRLSKDEIMVELL